MQTKRHLEGGTLRKVMAEEVRRAIQKYAGDTYYLVKAAEELGVTPRTLRVWKGPIELGGWKELQGFGGMEKILRMRSLGKTSKKKAKKRAKR